ncbi:TPA: Cro/CI family transcriptional regulator [Pseudomonas putida]|uniref:Cro/CI family transcriptional regulator n=1 Tax=Pseudomonas juntendi TaxID=2666183 RepID=UPI002448C68D|nr:Cro/CI family transcriptional regulator [Pseudomonas juntendi]MDG9890186.1 Cro/CI family transcriptional regulator [Pseudomonas juntendi]
MQRTPLAEYAAKRHAWTASRLGMSQGALSKAIREGRSIFVVVNASGEISAVEEKPFPGQRRGGSSACPQNRSCGSIESGPEVPVISSSTREASA